CVLASWIKLAILLSKEGLDGGLKIAVIVFGVLVLIGFCGILSVLIYVTISNNVYLNDDFENIRFESEIKTVVANIYDCLNSLMGEFNLEGFEK
ncbi:12517_t:CDS:2, partial [Gigaspora margarita]